MGVAPNPELEMIFDTVHGMGCTTEITVHYEGIAEELEKEDFGESFEFGTGEKRFHQLDGALRRRTPSAPEGVPMPFGKDTRF